MENLKFEITEGKMTAVGGSSRIGAVRTAATYVGALYGAGQTLTHAYESPLTTLLCEGVRNYTPEIIRNSTEIIQEIAHATLPVTSYLPVCWHYAGRAALILRGGFAAWSLYTWLRGGPMTQAKKRRWVQSAGVMISRAKEYHSIFEEMARTKRDFLNLETFNKVVDLNNSFTTIAHKNYIDHTLRDLLRIAMKTIATVENELVESRPQKKQKREGEEPCLQSK